MFVLADFRDVGGLQFALDIQLQETRAGSAVCSNNVEALLRETQECHFPRSPIENAAPLICLNCS